MSEVRRWLEAIGLAQYADAFEANDIDIDLLRKVDDQILKDIGVSSAGHRLRLRSAIAELNPQPTPEAKATTTLAVGESAASSAERRQLTILFCDLVGSTALSTQLDPEDMREVILAYQAACSGVMPAYDGFVAKFMGDGVLAYFGYPRAHEDDPERAVRAGLDIVAAVGRIKTRSGAKLQVRIGIATGLVVVGDLIGEGASQEQAVVGDTPNLAARLQSIADPNMVVIAESTRRLLGNLFELQGLGPKDLKGIAGPARTWVVLRASSMESRFEALHGTGLTALVGREEEIELLLRRWSKAKGGEGQVVLLSGEAGIGKSRLTAALLDNLSGEPHTRLRYFCSPQHTDSALYPIIGQMERAAGLTHDDVVKAKLDKLDAVLAQTSTPIEAAALFAAMLSLANDGRYPTLKLDPQEQRQRTLQALISQLESLAHHNPVLMIFEDAHWADPTSLEAFGRVVDRIQTLPVLLIVTFRPEFDAPWIGRAHVMTLTINRLAQRDVGAMIDRVVGNKLLPASIRQDIIERTDGIPLFVEEMTKAVLEAENESEAKQTAAAVPSPARAVPASLHASLMARLDRLGPAKEVAQIGAAIGREFSHGLLAAVAHKPEAQLLSALDRLIAAGLLFRQGAPPHATYLFKHALVQDAAYGTLLREPRRALHAHIAEVLDDRFPEIAESQPELLARHYTEAGTIERAAGFWGKAGQRSLERSALHEASEQLTRALSQIATLPGTPSSRHQEIMLQIAFRHVLAHLKGYAAPETKAALERTRQLFEQAEARGEAPEDPLLLFSFLNGLWTASIVAFNGEEACGLAAEFLSRAESQKAAAPIVDGYRIVGTSLLMTGDIADGREHFDRGIALCDSIDDAPSVTTRVGFDAKVVMLGFRSIALWLLGNPEAALAEAEHALSRAREITPVGTLMHTMGWTIFIQILCGHHAAAGRLIDELLSLADDKSTPFWKAWGMMSQGQLLAMTGKVSDAVHASSAGIAACESTGTTMCLPYYSSCLAMSYAELGHIDDARCLIRKAMTTIEETKERWFEAEIYRMAGEIERKSPNPGGANPELYFARALSVARTQQAKSLELRATMSMARLWSEQSRRDEARNLLAPTYNWFTEGFDTLDLRAAKVLLDGLAR